MAVVVTDEMRRAVYDEDCRRLGHLMSYDYVVQYEAGHDGGKVAGPDGKQPHLICRRCSRVWLVVEEPAENYQAAILALDLKLLPQFRPTRVVLGSGKPILPGLL